VVTPKHTTATTSTQVAVVNARFVTPISQGLPNTGAPTKVGLVAGATAVLVGALLLLTGRRKRAH
jgi:LPXTG-motif cell wall-anchored protein